MPRLLLRALVVLGAWGASALRSATPQLRRSSSTPASSGSSSSWRSPAHLTTRSSSPKRSVRAFSTPAGDAGDAVVDVEAVDDATDVTDQRERLKQALFAACAACDRGFGASAEDRRSIEAFVADLAVLNPTEDATAAWELPECPLRKCWRLIYTSAADVTILAANPVASLNGIYQDARDLPVVVNVIDTAPRVLALAPPQIADRLETAVRQKVYTRARQRSATRVGLAFERVEIAPLTLFGQSLENLPSLGFDLPQLGLDLQRQLFGVGAEADPRDDSPAYFDVLYVDEDTLAIQQASPGGLFVAVAVPELGETGAVAF